MTATETRQSPGQSVPDTVDVVQQPLLLRAADAASLCHVCPRTWRNWDLAGKIPQPVRVGRCVLWRYDELRAWTAAGCPDRELWKALWP